MTWATSRLRRQQQGMVSLIVTMILMIVLSILVIGFAQLSRREQRQALDRQLSTQAFYAAESGVNDAFRALKAGSGNVTTCTGLQIGAETFDSLSQLEPPSGSSTGIEYTCVLINKDLKELKYDLVGDTSKLVPINPTGGTMAKLLISWYDPNNYPPRPAGTDFLPNTNTPTPDTQEWGNHMGVLRLSLTPLASLNRDDLVNNTFTVFLYPLRGSGTGNVNFESGVANQPRQGQIISGQCDPTCSVQINLPHGQYLARVNSIYSESNVLVVAQDAGNNPLVLQDAQASIDSTGKANDVLRRIQVQASLLNNLPSPESALETADSICKLLQVAPGQASLGSGGGDINDPNNPCGVRQ